VLAKQVQAATRDARQPASWGQPLGEARARCDRDSVMIRDYAITITSDTPQSTRTQKTEEEGGQRGARLGTRGNALGWRGG